MKSKTSSFKTSSNKSSSFNMGLLRACAPRIWPLWAAYFIAWFLCLDVTIIFGSQGVSGILSCVNYAAPIGMSIYGILSAWVIWSFLFSRRGSEFYGSAPISRKKLFGGMVFVQLVPMVAINIVLFLISCLLGIGQEAAFFESCGLVLLVSVLLGVCFSGVATLCAILCGTALGMILVYLAFNFVIIVIELILQEILSVYIVGYCIGDLVFTWTSPLAYFMSHNIVLFTEVWTDTLLGSIPHLESMELTGMIAVVAYFAFGVVCYILSGFLIKIRRFEAASDTVVFGPVKTICKYLFATLVSLAFGVFLYEILTDFSSMVVTAHPSVGQTIALALFLIIGAAIGLIAAEIIIQKSARVIHLCWKGMIAMAACAIVFTALCAADVLGIQYRVPDVADVKSVETNYGAILDDEETIEKAIALHQEVVDELKAGTLTEIIGTYYLLDGEEHNRVNQTSFYLTYHLKNGTKIERHYYVWLEEADLDNPDSITAKYVAYRSTDAYEKSIGWGFDPMVDVFGYQKDEATGEYFLSEDYEGYNAKIMYE